MCDVKRLTRADVAARNGRAGAPTWVIIRDSVYDVTEFINQHPGGFDLIYEHAGKDATADFDDVGHSSDARKNLPKLKIGELIEEEKHFDANGKKKKRVVQAEPEQKSRSCLSIVTCGLLG